MECGTKSSKNQDVGKLRKRAFVRVILTVLRFQDVMWLKFKFKKKKSKKGQKMK